MFPKLARLSAFVSFALLLVAAGLYFAGIRAEKGSGSPANLVQQRVLQSLEIARQDASLILETYQTKDLFESDLIGRVKTPSFLYKNKTLFYWTDHQVLPDRELIRNTERVRAVEMRTGKFLVINAPVSNELVLVQYIPLERTYPVRNAFFSSGLNDDIFKGITASITLEKESAVTKINSRKGDFLFGLTDMSFSGSSPLITASVLSLLAAALLFICWLQLIAFSLYKQRKILAGIIIGIVPLFLFRIISIWFNFPFAYADIGFFNPRIFAASVWAQSVGDLLLTLLMVGLGALHVWYLTSVHFTKLAARAKKMPIAVRFILISGLYLWAVYMLFHVYTSLLANSRIELDITRSLQFTMYRVGLMAACVLLTGSFFLVVQPLMGWLQYIAENISRKRFAVVYCLLLLLAIPLWWFDCAELIMVLVIGLCYPLFSLLVTFRRESRELPFHLYLRLFVAAAISAAVGATAFYLHQQQRDIHQKEQIADNLLLKNDLLSEYLLHEAGLKIAADPMIKRQLLNPVVSIELITQKIMRQHVGSHFNAYDPKVHIFSGSGISANPADSMQTLKEYTQTLAIDTEKTSTPGLYLKTGQNNRQARTYIQFINIEEGDSKLATIVLELSLKRMPANSVLPRLLVDQRFSNANLEEGYSFAIYQDGRLITTNGDFDYRATFGDQIQHNTSVFEGKNFTGSGYSHYELKSNNITIIVSSGAYLLENSLANFSFLLLIFTAAIILAILIYAVLRPELRIKLWSSLSAKIQLLLSLGLLVPLAVISLAIISQVTKSYKEDIKAAYKDKGEVIQARISSYTVSDTLLASKEELAEVISDLAQLSDTEIHLYDNQGNLVQASQPLLFEIGLLSNYLNPEAYSKIMYKGTDRLLVSESAGRWSFNVLYMPVRSGSDNIAGFLALPFYDSEKDLDARINKLATTVMSIFTLIFLFSGLFTFIASRAVVVPLQIITEKLRRVTLSKRNEPIRYAADDELGLLVKEYNKMLQKLEESKQELAAQEKEQAWREMARQVAHEIKNPLTPMKLSMQYLQHALAAGHSNAKELVDRTANTIITQINVLSDIASSFSHFTSLPQPKNEVVALNSIIRRTVDLHNDPERNTVTADLPETEVKVIGDEDLLVRIFNNLVLNALQAVPASRIPDIVVKVIVLETNEVLAQVTDNGAGIPEEITEKVFVPNFSTKYAGSGIGLAVAKKGIEQMGGSLWFTTVLGEGTTFHIRLPLAG